MKKIYASLALLLAITTGTFAQRNVKLTYSIVDPVVDFNITTGLSFTPKYQVVNNGPDDLEIGDSLKFVTPVAIITVPITSAIPSGQGFTTVANQASNEGDIAYLLTLTGDTISRSRFQNNTQYNWFALHNDLVSENHAETITLTNTSAERLAVQKIWYNQTPTSVPEVTALKISNLNVFPNPAVNEVSFSLTTKADKAVARILDVTGRTVAVKEFTTLTNTNTINIANLPAGNYMLEVVAGDDKATSKFSVQK